MHAARAGVRVHERECACAHVGVGAHMCGSGCENRQRNEKTISAFRNLRENSDSVQHGMLMPCVGDNLMI